MDSPPSLGYMIAEGNHGFGLIRLSGECVINVRRGIRGSAARARAALVAA